VLSNAFELMKQEKLENMIRWTIALPLSLAIKVDIERKASNDTKSSWIRKAIEQSLDNTKNSTKNNTLEILLDEINSLKQEIKKLNKKQEGNM